MIKQHAESIKENSYWLGALNEYYWNGIDVNNNYEELVNGVTVKDIKKFAKKFLKQGNSIEVSMTDESAK